MNTIATAAELDALPVGSIVKVSDGLEMPASFWLNGKGGLWWTFAATHGYSSAEMAEGWAFTVIYRPDQQPIAQPTVEHHQLLGIGMVCACRGSWPCPDAEGVAEPRVSANSRSVANDPVAATPDQRPTAQPTVEQVERALHTHGWGSSYPRHTRREAATAVLALLPGRTEAAIKAEALREAAGELPGEITLAEMGYGGSEHWLVVRADRIEAQQ